MSLGQKKRNRTIAKKYHPVKIMSFSECYEAINQLISLIVFKKTYSEPVKNLFYNNPF